MTSVLTYLVCIDKLDILRAAGKVIKALVDGIITFSIKAFLDVLVNLISVNDFCGHADNTFCQIDLLLDGSPSVVDEAYSCDNTCDNQHCACHKEDDFELQRESVGLLFLRFGDFFI